MSLIVMVVVSMAWCAWIAYDAVQECRKIDRELRNRTIVRAAELQDNFLEVRS